MQLIFLYRHLRPIS